MTDIQELKLELASGESDRQRNAAEELLTADDCQAAAVELVRAVGTDDELLLEAANGVLERIESVNEEQSAELAAFLQSSDSECHPNSVYWAATLLGRTKEFSAAHVETLVEALVAALENCDDAAARQKVVWAIGQIGPQASAAGEKLQQLTDSTDARLARLAREAIEKICA